MTSAVTASIDLSALRHNLQRVREAAPGQKVMAVIKANAYGHGILKVAQALQGSVSAFAVARINEAILLRQAGIQLPIVCFEGFSDIDELHLVIQYRVQPVIYHVSQVELLESNKSAMPITVWLKIDSGMHRMGVPIELAQSCWQRLNNCEQIEHISLMTHLASADDLQSPQTTQQLGVFFQAIKGIEGDVSISNSAGILGWSKAQRGHSDWVRPGIMLYGVSPFIDSEGENQNLKPVMTLTSRLIAINQLKKGDPVGYGASWVCPEDMPVGVIACGYGDGYPRHAQPGTPVLVDGHIVELVGRVSMDTICVDLRNHPNVKPGVEVTLWGEGLPVERVAKHATTIAYELLCSVTGRVDFEWHD